MYACIDLGSNSFHLLIAQLIDGKIHIAERFSERVQLGEGVLSTGKISPAAYRRGMECLLQFKQHMDNHPLKQYWALGTNTFRVAVNSNDFVLEARRSGIDISVISGVQEAVLVYAGVVTDLAITEDRRFVADIGGGSTEVIIGQQYQRFITESLPIGCVTWRDSFFSDAGMTVSQLSDALDRALLAAAHQFAPLAPEICKSGWDQAYASSGTAKMLKGVIEAHGLGQAGVTLDALIQLRGPLIKAIADNSAVPGLKEKRRDLLLSGWSVMVAMLQTFKLESLHFSATALREGMLDFMAQNQKTLALMDNCELPAVSVAGLSSGRS